ncbi:MAG: copper oxidase [Gemmatimonadetes bacterium]|nr:copper oxidase [Gemmatimonadota bacterium]
MPSHARRRSGPPGRAAGALGLLVGALLSAAPAAAQTCNVTEAYVSAIDQPIWYNRLGAHDPAAMMFALDEDVVYDSHAGGYRLRPGKRPRPLVLRVREGDCLRVHLQNRLSHTPGSNQPGTRDVSIHVTGMQVAAHIGDDGTNVGNSVGVGQASYTIYAEKEGTYLLYSTAQNTGGDGDGGTLSKGLFGAVNVEPPHSEWYRSQVTAEDLRLATRTDASGHPLYTPAGHPVVDYDAVYPPGHALAGRPILRMTAGNRIVHSDLTAIISGESRGHFRDGVFPRVVVNRDRTQPFREYTVIFHDEPGLVQAFDSLYESREFEHTLHSGRDAFAINYGTAGLGSEVIGNRLGVGPMWDCDECKYEEFFLSSWAVGDPSMVVDVPADADRDGDGRPDPGRKATLALYPDDPSNVYHSYMNDHVKIRNLHAGPKEHHIFHLHAHQWLHSPDSDSSTYLDSQAIGPGGGFTYEITYDGGSNRNKTPGDAIFHCHFYPHFGQGMWALWRVHDVFEAGTVLDEHGRPAPGARALPDGEIEAGTPIPAVVPLPTYALAPMPDEGMAGFPFYIPGVAGRRAPPPPLDHVHDGGLPRHVVVDGEAHFPALNTTDFSKESVRLGVVNLPHTGTPAEERAMRFHAQRTHATYRFDPVSYAVSAAGFTTNGLGPVAGAPFADPCVDDHGNPAGVARQYLSAAFQTDVRYNKAGWHFPQHRMFALWEDVRAFLSGDRAPEPLYFRANTNDCITYNLVNLIPFEYQMDDFQVRTPTDVIGQHIHLVKFDVTSSDGAANGFNYEDGSLSPDEVRERIHAIRVYNGCTAADPVSPTCPHAVAHPFFGHGPDNNGDGVGDWLGAQETVQRWYVDDVRDATGRDRTLRTVFTHDHFGPSTHQQAGLYAGLVTEPAGSVWRDMHTGAQFGTRTDGGPTSWKADILTANRADSYREFNLQLADFTLAYTRGQPIGALGPNPGAAVNPAGKFEVGLPDLLRPPVAGACPNGTPAPCPELISADDVGTMVVNYRNEPLALRIGAGTTTQHEDLADAFVTGLDNPFTMQWGPYDEHVRRPGVNLQDPYTPLMWGYEGDKVQVRVLVGAHEEGHNFSIHGNFWNMEPADAASGWRNSQMMGISEHYEFLLPPLPRNAVGPEMDYLYRAGSATDDLWNGVWGLLRVSQRGKGYANLLQLPNNLGGNILPRNTGDFNGVCPRAAPVRSYDVTAILARDLLPSGTLVYNARPVNGGPLHDPTAILYVRNDLMDAVRSGARPPEPLVLRANAGECIQVVLYNHLPDVMPDLAGFNTLPMIVDQFNNNHIRVSNQVGLHAQLLAYDVTRSDGTNVGGNPIQTVGPGGMRKYQWYAGTHTLVADTIASRPVEFGVVNLMPADPLKQAAKGAIGALVVEPDGATWDNLAGVSADIQYSPYCPPDEACVHVMETFREHVLFFQTDVNLRFGSDATLPGDHGEAHYYASGSALPHLAGIEDAEDSGNKAFNYRTEPLWFRMGYSPETSLSTTRGFVFTKSLLNGQVGGDPQTPVFTAMAGEQVRFRVVAPGGHARNSVFNLHGHVWPELPYLDGSTRLGWNPLSEWKGTTIGHGPTNHFDVLLPSAGGRFGIEGDYLFRDQTSHHFDGGMWGIFRVGPGYLFDGVSSSSSDSCTVNAETGEVTCP